MSNVSVEKVRDPNAAPASVIERMQVIANRIRERAYDLFQSRGATDGAAMEDWLQAERDLLVLPQSDLIEKGGKFNIRVEAPGFSADEIHVTATPDAIIVTAEASRKESAEGYTEFGQKQLFQRLELPTSINPDKVTASLEDGILELVAEKAAVGAKVKTSAGAA
jgi:HSP20 family protein